MNEHFRYNGLLDSTKEEVISVKCQSKWLMSNMLSGAKDDDVR
jgi:hypothetical protein